MNTLIHLTPLAKLWLIVFGPSIAVALAGAFALFLLNRNLSRRFP